MNKFIYLGMAARMVPDKLHDLFLNIILDNKKFFDLNKIKVLLAGDGISKNTLQEKTKHKNLNNIVIFNGSLRETDLINWFKKIDIYIHLSKDETTSTSILQAMSMSLPVIASDIGGNRNLRKSIKNINNITLVKNNKIDVFAKIKHLIINKEKRVKMSKIARITAEKYYSCERMFKDYQKLF